MTQHQYAQHAPARQYQRPEPREKPGFESDVAPDRVEEVSLRIEAPGYGGAPLSAFVPVETLAEIERGDRPVDTDLKIRVPGYGWRVVEARVLPRDEGGAPGEARSVRMRMPGYGGATVRMTFPGRTLG